MSPLWCYWSYSPKLFSDLFSKTLEQNSYSKDERGFEEQVKKLSDQVKLISEKLAYLTPNEQRSVLVNNKKASKQV
jgi:hypothetical protein